MLNGSSIQKAEVRLRPCQPARYIVELPQGEVIGINQAESNISNNFATLRARLRRLPPIHQTTFQAIIEHLGRVQSRSASNKMDAKVGWLP